MERAGPEPRIFRCPECPTTCPDADALGAHIERHSPLHSGGGEPRTVSCPAGCGRTFPSPRKEVPADVRTHAEACDGQPPLPSNGIVCPRCRGQEAFLLADGRRQCAQAKCAEIFMDGLPVPESGGRGLYQTSMAELLEKASRSGGERVTDLMARKEMPAEAPPKRKETTMGSQGPCTKGCGRTDFASEAGRAAHERCCTGSGTANEGRGRAGKPRKIGRPRKALHTRGGEAVQTAPAVAIASVNGAAPIADRIRAELGRERARLAAELTRIDRIEAALEA